MKKIAVGSTNPAKIEAVRLAFTTVWPNEQFQIEGISTYSGVSAQPMSDEESITGARNRARSAITQLKADFGVGLEGGLQKTGEDWFDCGWMAIVDSSGTEGIGSTIKIIVPPKVMAYIDSGKELGEAIDIIFSGTNFKQGVGYFGLMTNNHITRATGYRDGVISALAVFIHPHLR